MLSHFLGEYKRGFYGRSRFIWTPATLGIIIRGYFQFHRSVPSVQRVSLVRIAPHLRALIRDYVKSLVCESHFAEDHFFKGEQFFDVQAELTRQDGRGS